MAGVEGGGPHRQGMLDDAGRHRLPGPGGDRVRALAAVLAPVVSELRGERADSELLCRAACDEGLAVAAATEAIPVVRLHLGLLGPLEYSAALERFPAACAQRYAAPIPSKALFWLHLGGLPEGPASVAARGVVDLAAVQLGELTVVWSAVAAAWWAVLVSATAAGRDPVEVAQRLCLRTAAAG